MASLENAPNRIYDPIESVLAHLPDGMYGAYEGLCNYVQADPLVPPDIKEGLRFLSAVRIGCEFCSQARYSDANGHRLLPDDFYDAAAERETPWEGIVDRHWAPVFGMADEVLGNGVISAETMKALKAELTESQIVEALFFMLIVGASHRFSRALGIEAACRVPTELQTTAAQAPGPS
jgi:alkylhydroperoxidase family enzyme